MFFRALISLLDIIGKHATEEFYDEEGIKKHLLELHLAFEMRDIEQKEYEKYRDNLLERLSMAQRLKMEALEEAANDEDEDGDEEGFFWVESNLE